MRTMEFPIIEIVDRYAIAVVKHEKTDGANRFELDFYLDQMKLANINPLHSDVIALIEHHSYVWSLEEDFKKGRVDYLPFVDIGSRAIIIRDAGHQRQLLKNKLAALAGDPVREIKQ